MKNVIFVLCMVSIISCKAQHEVEFDYDNFEQQFLAYEPIQNTHISAGDFDYATMIISETKSATKNNPTNFNLSDYFNILSALLTLKESEKNINTAFEKFKNAEGSCEYMIAFEKDIEKNQKYDIIRSSYLEALNQCKNRSTPIVNDFNIDEYCTTKALNCELVKQINQIKISDHKYRFDEEIDWDKQTALDKQNQQLIDSLFNIYNAYIGQSLVGEKFEHVMWSVVQHAPVEMMEKYLPVIQQGVHEKELKQGPFKMLIDRYYGLKYGYQIFGTQTGFGFELADAKTREAIKIKHAIK